MAWPFTVYNAGLLGMGQASTPTSISLLDIEDELAARGYTPSIHVPAPGPVRDAVEDPADPLPPLLVPDLHVPYEPVSQYYKYLRFLPYLVAVFEDKSVLDLGKIV